MARVELPIRSLKRSSRLLPSSAHSSSTAHYNRQFSTSPLQNDTAPVETQPQPPHDVDSPFPPPLSSSSSSSPSSAQLPPNPESPAPPRGPRRLRALLQRNQSSGIPFSQLPYQCFQEARAILQADRATKLVEIETQRARIARLRAEDAAVSGGEVRKRNRLFSMQRYLEELKIKADINDPMVKKRFEDGEGDMNKPIYRYLANRKWREYRRPVLMQRITQMSVVPDVLSDIDPIVDITMSVGGRGIQPGEFVQSTRSETPPKLRAQLFEQGEKLVTIAVVDSDVPNVEKDGFDTRCHFLASNIPITPTSPFIDLAKLRYDDPDVSSEQPGTTTSASVEDKHADSSINEEAQLQQPTASPSENPSTESTSEPPPNAAEDPAHPPPAAVAAAPPSDPQVILPWLPPTSHLGAPYHRLSLFLLHQKDNTPINTSAARKRLLRRRDGFKLRSFCDIHQLRPIGVNMFRVQFDEVMDDVMRRLGVMDAGGMVEFKRRKVEPLPYRRRNPATFR